MAGWRAGWCADGLLCWQALVGKGWLASECMAWVGRLAAGAAPPPGQLAAHPSSILLPAHPAVAPNLCAPQIRGYPTLKVYHGGAAVDTYKGVLLLCQTLLPLPGSSCLCHCRDALLCRLPPTPGRSTRIAPGPSACFADFITAPISALCRRCRSPPCATCLSCLPLQAPASWSPSRLTSRTRPAPCWSSPQSEALKLLAGRSQRLVGAELAQPQSWAQLCAAEAADPT